MPTESLKPLALCGIFVLEVMAFYWGWWPREKLVPNFKAISPKKELPGWSASLIFLVGGFISIYYFAGALSGLIDIILAVVILVESIRKSRKNDPIQK